MNVEIEYLADRMDVIPTLARWHQDEWGARTPHLSLADRIARFEAWACRKRIPTAFVAMSGGTLVGCASLVEHDMKIRTDLSPWLASVLVTPSHRRQGVGSTLSERVAHEARVLGVDKLYLFTFDKESFYARLGWAVVDRTDYLGAGVTIMVRHLAG
jgi:GNAT superfamily N-acetyltransferase